jgi:hypothetical protein
MLAHDSVLFSETSRLALKPTQSLIQWVPGFLPGCKTAGEWCWPLTTSKAEVKNKLSHTSTPPIGLHGVDGDFFYMKDSIETKVYSYDDTKSVPKQFVNTPHRADKLSAPLASYMKVSGNHWLLRGAENGSDVDTRKGRGQTKRAEVSRQLILAARRNQKNFRRTEERTTWPIDGNRTVCGAE